MRNEYKCVSVYVPDSLENNNVGFLPGFIQREGSDVKFYITDDKLRDVRTGCIGYCGLADMECAKDRPNYWIRVSFSNGQFQVSHILCDAIQEYKLLYVFYDFRSFKKSNVILTSQKNRDDFFYLSKSLSDKVAKQSILTSRSLWFRFINFFLVLGSILCYNAKRKVRLLEYSSTFLHIENNIAQARCVLEDINRKRRLTLSVQNVVVSKLLDFCIGLLVLKWFSEHHNEVSQLLSDSANSIITQIAELLKFLMGSPVGLKLNKAFNTALGNFVFYHMSLWNTFLSASAPIAGAVRLLALCIAAFGVTYQTALASDFFTLATFHVYCIYVYTARLYGVQIHGLIALWRLFRGRKYNPLKDRVDTYRYNSHQLFVGTLAFSILLFLLPTTGMYYTVFVTLRLILIVVSTLLENIRSVIRDFPVYLSFLWLLNSPKIRGDVHVAVGPTGGALTVHATVRAGSWKNCCYGVSTMMPKTAPLSMRERPEKSLVQTILCGYLI